MVENNEIEKIKRNNQEVTPYDFIICPNCGADEVGKFCPNCGQSNKDFNKPLKEILGDLLDSINLDIRLLNTIIPFFTKPGFLTQEYFNGKRRRYVPPMRMYMFFSILFFFLVQYVGSDKMKDNLMNFDEDPKTEKASIISMVNSDTLQMNSENTDSINNNQILTLDNLSSFDKDKAKQDVLNDTTASDQLKKTIIGGLNASEKKDLFFSKFMKNLSYVLFLLMPVFALILGMILWRSKMLYVKHLIFSINFHSFIFGLSSICMLLGLILPKTFSGMEFYLLWGMPLYLMIGIKRFYNRKLVGSFFKMFGALVIYFFVISIVITSILMITAKGFYDI